MTALYADSDAFHTRTGRCVDTRAHVECGEIEAAHQDGHHSECLPAECDVAVTLLTCTKCGGSRANHFAFCEDAPPRPTRDPDRDLQSALAWIHHVASAHYMGGAFDPEHMRGIANLASEALAGKPVPDFNAAMERARASARERFQDLRLDFQDGGLVDHDTTGD